MSQLRKRIVMSKAWAARAVNGLEKTRPENRQTPGSGGAVGLHVGTPCQQTNLGPEGQGN